MSSLPNNEPSEDPVLGLVGRIKDKKLDPKNLLNEDRRRCVAFLRTEGYSVPEIAQILQRSERTIFRDIDEIRQQHAISPDPRFAERMIGEMLQQAETSIGRLRRLARDANQSGMERLMAEGSAWKVFREMFQLLQSVGYLPRIPASVVADVYHNLSADPVAGWEELEAKLAAIDRASTRIGVDDPNLREFHHRLRDEISRGLTSARIERIKDPHS